MSPLPEKHCARSIRQVATISMSSRVSQARDIDPRTSTGGPADSAEQIFQQTAIEVLSFAFVIGITH
jgi:hypothetical protein